MRAPAHWRWAQRRSSVVIANSASSAIASSVRARQQGSAVLLTGEAGVGKSRLVRELATMSAGTGAVILEGRCVAIGSEPLRCAALLELLRASAPAQSDADRSDPAKPSTAGPVGSGRGLH